MGTGFGAHKGLDYFFSFFADQFGDGGFHPEVIDDFSEVIEAEAG